MEGLGTFVTFLTFKCVDDEWKKYQRQLKETSDEADKTDKKLGLMRATAGGLFKGLAGANFAMATIKGFKECSKAAREFEFALMDIKKVHPHIDVEQAKKDILNLSRVAVGKDISADLAKAYKLGVQTLGGDQSRLPGFMELVEKQSRAYDTKAEQTAKLLSFINTNYGMTNQELAVLGDKMAYSHHNYGNAMVPDLMSATSRVSGMTAMNGISTDMTLALSTQLLNTGTQASEIEGLFRRLLSRVLLGTEGGQRITGMKTAWKSIGMDGDQFVKEMKKDADTALMKLFTALEKYQKEGKNLTPILKTLAGLYSYRDMAKIVVNLDKIRGLLDVYKGVKTDANGKRLYEGEVDRAYETLKNTTEFQRQAFESAKQRFKIELGNALAMKAMRVYYESATVALDGFVNAINAVKAPFKDLSLSISKIVQSARNVGQGVKNSISKLPIFEQDPDGSKAKEREFRNKGSHEMQKAINDFHVNYDPYKTNLTSGDYENKYITGDVFKKYNLKSQSYLFGEGQYAEGVRQLVEQGRESEIRDFERDSTMAYRAAMTQMQTNNSNSTNNHMTINSTVNVQTNSDNPQEIANAISQSQGQELQTNLEAIISSK